METKKTTDTTSLLSLLDQLRRGVDYSAWTGGLKFKEYLLQIIDTFIDLHTNCTMVPKIEGLLLEEANKFLVNSSGFEPMNEEEWLVFCGKLFQWVDWQEAILRTFWEEILPRRLGPEAHINQLYIHTYQHCDVEWSIKWYISHTSNCPICGEHVFPTTSLMA